MNTIEHADQAYSEGRIAASHAIARSCLSRAQERGDQLLEAQALWQIAQAGMVCGDVARALAEARRATLLFASLADHERKARSLITVAYAATLLRDNDLALASGQYALQLSEELGSLAPQAAANNYLGIALFWNGDPVASDRHLRVATDLARRIGRGNAHARPMVNRATGALVHMTFERVFHDRPPDPSRLTPLVGELRNGCDLAGALPFLSAGFQLDCEAIAAWPSFFAACWRRDFALARDCLALCSSRAASSRLALRWIEPYVDWARHEYACAIGRWEQAASAADDMVGSAARIQNRQLFWLGSALKLRALEGLGRGDDAARGWRSLIALDMEERRALRSSSDWVLQLQHRSAGSGMTSGPAVERLPLPSARIQRQRRLADWTRRRGLTPAEGAVLELLGQGLPPRIIASMRGTAVGTVRSQLRMLFDKTGIHSQQALIAAFNAAGDETQ